MANPLIVEQSRAIPVTPAEAFARTLPMPLPTLFHRWYGPIPPIKAVRDQTREWAEAGQTRTIALAGGGSMGETLTAPGLPVFGRIWRGYARHALESLSDYLVG